VRSTDRGNVLLLGSVARPEDGWTVEDVFRRSAEFLGDDVSMLPDGELGDRSQWITFVARHAYSRHPDLVTLSRHTFEDWKPKHYDDQWRFAVREGVERVRFPTIGYAEEAKRSYQVFARLRAEGAIRTGIRFLVALPGTESAVRPFVQNARDFELLWDGYSEALRKEIAEIAAAIPEDELAIQWDLARETAAIEGIEFGFADASLAKLPSDPMERYCLMLGQLSNELPEGIWLGLHVCYGSLLHQEGESPDSAHYTPIRDLTVSVEMLNRGVPACGRRVDFAHMPVQLSEKSDAFYRPLADLDVAGARVYIGLVDPSDGVEGALERIALARPYLSEFGLATPCGWGRRPLSQRPEGLLSLERAVLDAAQQTSWG
jgi:hypothetical protein